MNVRSIKYSEEQLSLYCFAKWLFELSLMFLVVINHQMEYARQDHNHPEGVFSELNEAELGKFLLTSLGSEEKRPLYFVITLEET